MFTFLKIIQSFLLPPSLIALGLVACLFFFIRGKQKTGTVLLTIVLLFYYLLSIEPIAYFFAKSLEKNNKTIALEKEAANVEAIVILAGGVNKKGGGRIDHELSGPSWRRLWHGIELFKKFKGELPILFSGGSGDPFDPTPVEAYLAKSYATTIGIPDGMFWVESKSRNTFESGIEIKRILDEHFAGVKHHRIILVTSALHMPRSIAVMKKIGLNPIPSSADFAIGKLTLDPFSFFPSLHNLYISNFAIHEWIGIGGYKLLGRI